ncbi:MAG: IS4 family transposase [Proteobacteria bacterium]|nr:IS4 family transposase [Pseudomonadota bacterium]
MEQFSEILDDLAAMGPRGLARFEASIDPSWIEQALAHTGKASIRRRKLPADMLVWLIVGMALFRDRSIVNVVEHLNLVAPGVESLAPRAARCRADGVAVPQDCGGLFERAGAAYLPRTGAVRDRRQPPPRPGLRRDFEFFGKPGGRGGSGDAGYPQARIAVLLNLRSRLLADARFGPFGTSEQSLAREMISNIPDASVTVLDRGFISYALLAEVVGSEERERNVMIRLRADQKFTDVKLLPDGSALARMRPSKEARRKHDNLPDFIQGRIVHYQHEGGTASRLFVTLTDWELYPALALVGLYHERWELEVGYDELKTHMFERVECLRSLSPNNVIQELWGLLLVYNLVRREMLLVALEHGLPPTRVSFRTAVLTCRDFWLITAWGAPGRVPRHLADLRMTLSSLIIPPRRSHRRYPRHVKIKMSNYPRNRGTRTRDGPK